MPRTRLTKRKRLVFSIMLLLIVVGVCELISYAAIEVLQVTLPFDYLRQQQQSIASGSFISAGASEAFHPFVGWVHNPQVALPEKHGGREIPVNHLGFRDDSESLYRRAPDCFIVGIAGGSVAWNFSWEADLLLRERLERHPGLAGRKIQFVRMAMPGYKQPQQLMVYNYLLSLGAEFDLIINIDGFNETALTVRENFAMHTALVYPRSWHARTVTMTDPRVSADASRLLYLRGKRQQMAKSMIASWFRWSPTVNLIWHWRDQRALSELTDLGFAVSQTQSGSFLNHGPVDHFESDTQMHDEVAAIWKRSSLQMHRLCHANGTRYLHVLQPNQYFPDSKPLSEHEKKFCYGLLEGSSAVIEALYPILLREGRTLTAAGVAFSNQTMVFADVEETLYTDAWCHFNSEGNRLLGIAIAEEVITLLGSVEN